MKTTTPSIFMIPASDFTTDQCGVCGSSCILQFRDSSTGMKVGACCLQHLIYADNQLSSVDGIRRPTPQESSQKHD